MNLATDNTNKLLDDVLTPLETRLMQKMDSLVREAAQARGQLNKVNDLKNDVQFLEEKLSTRPTNEEIDQRFTKLHNYTPLTSFKGL